MAVMAMAHNIADQYFGLLSKSNVKKSLAIYCIIDHNRNEATTEPSIHSMIVSTFAVFIYVESCSIGSSDCAIFTTPIHTAPQSKQNTIDTVVEVGIPKELNLFKSKISATMTDKNKIVISRREKY
jgi:outer membrane PBP1 activator LpoA protein